ncbi:MAG: hypothetical protein KZQ84_14515, partial [Candidatus Thiodiazotropha sp. (ex Lucinoma borealis)]|nr:hypothetical protein [Candidatus Thiodiazotropha sp. (ex Lucinoma borealis)]
PSGARHNGSTVSPHGYRGLTASAFTLPGRSAVEGKDTVIVLCASGSFGNYDVLFQDLLMGIFSLLEDLQID